jgi:hypothetical protein
VSDDDFLDPQHYVYNCALEDIAPLESPNKEEDKRVNYILNKDDGYDPEDEYLRQTLSGDEYLDYFCDRDE